MKFDFDTIIPRKNTQCVKHDKAESMNMPIDAIPLWVADMDFQAPPAVLQALNERVDHGVFGYSCVDQEYYDALIYWMKKRHNWNIEADWVIATPGVVFAIRAAIAAFTQSQDAILIHQPVYTPFTSSVVNAGRTLVTNELVLENGRYTIDFEEFERKIVDNSVKLFILCSPHNPVGRVWTKEELTRMADICIAHGVLIVSDEIHQDFVFPGHRHHVLTTLKEDYHKHVIVCTAPSKTFNVAGLQTSNIMIADQALRQKFKQQVNLVGYDEPNTMGLLACQAAYAHGEEWLDELLVYLEGNVAFVTEFFATHLPQITTIKPEGTYLLWVDFSQLSLAPQELQTFISHKAKLWFSAGSNYGIGGESFQRINLGTSRKILEQALQQLKDAISTL